MPPVYARTKDILRPTIPFSLTSGNFFSRSDYAMIRVYDELDNVIETHEHAGEFKELHS